LYLLSKQELLDALMTPEAIETPHLFDPDRVR
jgi:hypothetical protein